MKTNKQNKIPPQQMCDCVVYITAGEYLGLKTNKNQKYASQSLWTRKFQIKILQIQF